MAHCFLCRCIVPVIMVFHLVVGGGGGADVDGGDGDKPCNCDFQNDMCCWKGLPLSTRAVWERPNGTVGHHESMTGQILKDHTYQNDTKCYVHVSARNEIAILQSYALKMSTIYCLRFWYYIEVGPGKGNLHVILVNYTTGDIKGAEAQSAWTAPSRTPTNTYWIGAEVEIYYKDLFRIFFLASYVDYTAIDDITLIETPCEVRPTDRSSLTLGTISVSKSSTSHVSPSISSNTPDASRINWNADVLAVRPTDRSSLTLGTISVSKPSTSHESPSISTNTPEASLRNGRTEFLAEKPSVAISSGSFGSPFVSTPTFEASRRTGSTDAFAVANLIQNSNRTGTTISISELKSTDGQFTSRKSVSFRTPSYKLSNTEILYICIGAGCFLLLSCCIVIFLCWKRRKRSQNCNDIENSTPKSVPFPTSPYAAEPIKQNGDNNHGFSTSLYTIEQEIAVSHEIGNGVQMLSESAKETYQGKDFQVIQRDQRVLTERTNGADKMGSKSIFTKSKQSCNSSVAHGSKGKTMQIKVFETGLESNTGQTVLPSTSKGREQTKPNSLTSFAVEGSAIHISSKRDEDSNTYSGRNHNENLLLKTLNPPQNERSGNNVTYDSKAMLGTQQRNAHGQPFNYMVVSPGKANDSSNKANKMHVKFTSDHIF